MDPELQSASAGKAVIPSCKLPETPPSLAGESSQLPAQASNAAIPGRIPVRNSKHFHLTICAEEFSKIIPFPAGRIEILKNQGQPREPLNARWQPQSD